MPELRPISIMLYKRLLSYLRFLKRRPAGGPASVSSAAIARALGLHEVQVRKDLASVSSGGKPKVGYVTKGLVADLEHFLGHDNLSEAVIVGAGNLGRALMSYENFESYGLKIVAAFDSSPAVAGKTFKGVDVLDASRIPDLCRRLGILIGIIAVPAPSAQEACDALLAGGVRAVWNFAPVNLEAPDGVVVRNEDMGASLALLMKSLKDMIDPPPAPRPARRRPRTAPEGPEPEAEGRDPEPESLGPEPEGGDPEREGPDPAGDLPPPPPAGLDRD